jgi:acetate kinase
VTGPIAVFNAGSSSIKFALYGDEGEELLYRGQVEKIGTAPRLSVKDARGKQLFERSWTASQVRHHEATEIILQTSLDLIEGQKVAGVGHRVVHGGTHFHAPALIDADIVEQLTALTPLAPLHQPHNLGPIRTIAAAAPHLPQVACFDTAFHQTQPQLAQLYALPRELSESGIRRYGFHGLSYEYISDRLRDIAPPLSRGRAVVAHLGNGASLCALRGGASQATTMGFTAVEGLVMGTRCGSLDPGVLLYLMDERGMTARDIEQLVYKQSGLLGVSGISSDMRELQASPDPAAALAIDLFVYRIVREVGSLAAALGGIDGIVFTGGIGENDASIRRRVVDGCAWLGASIDIDEGPAERRISRDLTPAEVWVIPTDEEGMIARHTHALLAGETAAA